jgi:hypothetical protein
VPFDRDRIDDLLRRAATACDHLLAMPRALAAMVLLVLAGCAVQTPTASPSTPTADSMPAVPQAAAPPSWRPGDRWIYGWTSGAERGVKTVEAVEIREINRVSFYLVRVGEVEIFYTLDLHWAGTMEAGRVAARMTPPQPLFEWPLEAGRSWTHRGTYEDRSGRTTFNDTFAVVGTEVVEVPAGRFNTFKIVRQTERRDTDQYWYAPEVRFYVKWIGRRGDTQFEEELREYHPAARLIPAPASTRPPSTK